jgi:uncharacterized protein (DUF952 family)
MTVIYHLITRTAWEAARSASEYRAESLETEGFIHCSQDLEQMLQVANRLYAGRDDMLVLEVDTDRLDSPIKREPSRSGEIYPHIYGPLNKNAVVRALSLKADANGSFISVHARD